MIRHRTLLLAVTLLALVSALTTAASAQRLEVPRRHDRPPGPPLSPEEAVARMTVPEGFSVEIVAAEPDVVNPVAMCIDEKGRFWVTESFEYPRREPGAGRDRVKVLEDTTGDGKVDKVTVFADGLNIPSGVAVGYGGVWVANAPDILFMQDTDGDGKADKIEKVVTGFGRLDTHELPNSLTWGPDGWLYGLNGVFNNSHVKYTPENPNYEADHAGWPLTCAMFRIHPRTREFQIFAEGTSNPWGIAFNDEGDAFISACVIDHLWHIVETGYYIRQGGPYPPHTWPMRSIVDHKHQKAAYCGITWFDSDAYPEEYRGVLYMGNIHGGCINADIVERSGSTYKGKPHPGFPAKPGAWDDDEYDTIRKTGDPENPKLADFLTASDPWFMPVVQKTGPDGCLYILDWYDRYHCYQDANADPEGIDRSRGRLYRVRYKDTPHAQPFDLAKESDEELIDLLGDPNVYYRDTAQRLLGERDDPSIAEKLRPIVFDQSLPTKHRLSALFAWAGMSGDHCASFSLFMDYFDKIEKIDSPIRRWCVRLVHDAPEFREDFHGGLELRGEKNLDEWLQWSDEHDDAATHLQQIVGYSKLHHPDVMPILVHRLAHCGDDSLIPHIVWQNLHPLLREHSQEFLALVKEYDLKKHPNLAKIMPRATEVILDQQAGK
jgi:putative membrane-bound dehydrogenase-like protein